LFQQYQPRVYIPVQNIYNSLSNYRRIKTHSR
jgi:hypothetical protein